MLLSLLSNKASVYESSGNYQAAISTLKEAQQSAGGHAMASAHPSSNIEAHCLAISERIRSLERLITAPPGPPSPAAEPQKSSEVFAHVAQSIAGASARASSDASLALLQRHSIPEIVHF